MHAVPNRVIKRLNNGANLKIPPSHRCAAVSASSWTGSPLRQHSPCTLPAYSPDLNPIENLWKFIKSNFLCNKWIKGGKQILKAGIDAVKKLTPEMIKSVCARNYGMT